MNKKYLYLIAVVGFCAIITYFSYDFIFKKNKKVVIFTDFESDDAVAIALFLKYLKDNDAQNLNNVLFGTELANQYIKKDLLQKLVKLYGFSTENIFAGSGGGKYPTGQGTNILSEQNIKEDIQKYYDCANGSATCEDKSFEIAFKEFLINASTNSVDLIFLTKPTEFCEVLNFDENLIYKIDKIYMMGGWCDMMPNYNWRLDLPCIEKLVMLLQKIKNNRHSPKLFLFSGGFFKQEFNGFVNYEKFPEVINVLQNSPTSVAKFLKQMIVSWDTYITSTDTDDEALKTWHQKNIQMIGQENIGRQFTPADPATMVGYLYHKEFVLKVMPVEINFIHTDDKVYVDAKYNSKSNIYAAEKVDKDFFRDKLVEMLSA